MTHRPIFLCLVTSTKCNQWWRNINESWFNRSRLLLLISSLSIRVDGKFLAVGCQAADCLTIRNRKSNTRTWSVTNMNRRISCRVLCTNQRSIHDFNCHRLQDTGYTHAWPEWTNRKILLWDCGRSKPKTQRNVERKWNKRCAIRLFITIGTGDEGDDDKYENDEWKRINIKWNGMKCNCSPFFFCSIQNQNRALTTTKWFHCLCHF